MRRARGSTSDQEQPGRRQRRRVVQEPAGQAAPRGRQHRGARVAPAAAAATAGGGAAAPSRHRRGPPPPQQQHESDDAQEQYSNEEQDPEQTSDYDEGEESQPEETSEERRIGRQLLRDLGAASSDTDHTDDDDEHDSDDDSDDGDEFDDRNPDEDEFAEEEDEDDDGGEIDYGEGFVIFGGDDYDIVVGGPPHHPVRSTGIIPNVNPTTDTQIAPGVYARQEPDGKHCLFGAPLRHVPKLLERILQMRQQQGQLLWKSSIVLGQREWGFIKEVLGHERIQPLLQRGERVLKPLPDAGFPQALRPRDSSGTPLQGPKVTRNGKPWNVGRQYFSSFKSGDMSSFLWADGVGGFEAEAQGSFSDYMFG